ncbi:hypothetical protein Pmani_032014 [Petrolisthes manimaculis]|uniref:Uncharacterized protein n=1 Tax=Petrolisthes manimaculis TaxID=1843537 RepID=A0AAE1NTZ2_9EUCA|nr:hypothetical protein Pmani_032014 [Petrolisthes manimaculis]
MWNTLKPDQTRPSKKEESVWGVTTQLVLLLQVPCCPHQTPEALQEAGDSSRCNHDYNEAGCRWRGRESLKMTPYTTVKLERTMSG